MGVVEGTDEDRMTKGVLEMIDSIKRIAWDEMDKARRRGDKESEKALERIANMAAELQGRA
jgi:hypothetical protein